MLHLKKVEWLSCQSGGLQLMFQLLDQAVPGSNPTHAIRLGLYLGYLQPAMRIVYNTTPDKDMLKSQHLPLGVLNSVPSAHN